MKNLKNIYRVFLFSVVVCTMFHFTPVYSQQVRVLDGDPTVNLIYAYNNAEISLKEFKKDKILLLAFIPTVKKYNDYASVLTQSFDIYFAEGLSFGEDYTNIYDKYAIAIVSNDSEQDLMDFAASNTMDYPFISDNGLSKKMGVDLYNADNSSATVMIVDNNDNIAYTDNPYRGEGEKLKALQDKLFAMLDIKRDVTEKTYSPLITGDDARDFEFAYTTLNKNDKSEYPYIKISGDEDYTLPEISAGKLSEFKGKNVLLGFYPAPFSFSCGGEISDYTTMIAEDVEKDPVSNSAGNEETFTDLEVLMVSNQNMNVMKRWMKDMNFADIKLISDESAEIASMYSSFNANYGYNRRTVFLINKEGKIAYIDWDYDVVNDLELLKSEIKKLP